VDGTGAEMLADLQTALHRRGVRLALSGVKKQVLDVLHRTGLAQQIGHDNLFVNNRDAIRALRRSAPGSSTQS